MNTTYTKSDQWTRLIGFFLLTVTITVAPIVLYVEYIVVPMLNEWVVFIESINETKLIEHHGEKIAAEIEAMNVTEIERESIAFSRAVSLLGFFILLFFYAIPFTLAFPVYFLFFFFRKLGYKTWNATGLGIDPLTITWRNKDYVVAKEKKKDE